MFLENMINERKVIKAFQTLFTDENHHLKKEAEIVLAALRDEAGARGELGHGTQPYFYDAENRFDPNAAIFAMGKRRMFDFITAYLSLDEQDYYNLTD